MYNPTPNLPAGNLYNNGAVRFDTRQIQNYLLQEQRMLQQQQAAQRAAVDKMLQDEIGKVRSADTQGIVDTYNNYKNVRSQLYNKKNQRDPVKYAELQRASDLAYRDLMGGINGSIELKEREKKRFDAYSSNPMLFADDFGDRMAVSTRTPTKHIGKVLYKGKEEDFGNEEKYRYNGADFNLAELTQKAEGTVKNTGHSDEQAIDKFSHREIPYQFGNTPSAYKDYLLSGLSERKAGRAAAFEWDNIPKAEIEKTIQEFKAIHPDKWKKMNITPQEIKSANPDNKAENWATYKAMRYAIDKNPVAGTPATIMHTEDKMNQEQENRMALAKYNKGANESLAKLKHKWKTEDDDGKKATMGAFVDDMIKGAQKHRSQQMNIHGKMVDVWTLPNMPSLKKSMQVKDRFGKDVQPNQFVADKDGNIYPVFYEMEKTTKADGTDKYTGNFKPGKIKGRIKFDPSLTTKLSKQQIVAELSKQMLPGSKVELGTEEEEVSTTKAGMPSSPEEPAPFD